MNDPELKHNPGLLKFHNWNDHVWFQHRREKKSKYKNALDKWNTSHWMTVAERQSYMCHSCGQLLTSTWKRGLRVPIHQGGSNAYNNLILRCNKCHVDNMRIEFKRYHEWGRHGFGVTTSDYFHAQSPKYVKVDPIYWLRCLRNRFKRIPVVKLKLTDKIGDTKVTTRRQWTFQERIKFLHRQNYRCNLCKKMCPSTCELDHRIPLWMNGLDHADNLQMLCPSCHAKKTQRERMLT